MSFGYRKILKIVLGDQRGAASMMTVAMFMMIFSVITVGFTYIVVNTSRQAINNSLYEAARSAAESGVEDAKRLLSYCYKMRGIGGTYRTPSAQRLCAKVVGNALDNLTCTDVLNVVDSNSDIRSTMPIESDHHGGFMVRVGGAKDKGAKHYQCLKIGTLSNDYVASADGDGRSRVVPLRMVYRNGAHAKPANVTVEWHLNAKAPIGENLAAIPPHGTNLPSSSSWKRTNVPAALRLELAGVKKSNVSRADLMANDVAVVLRPSTSGSSSIGRLMGYQSPSNSDPLNVTPNKGLKNGKDAPLVPVRCSSRSNQQYACKTTFKMDSSDSYNYYLRLNAIYRSTTIRITATDSAGKNLFFDGAQIVVDVTGRSADSFNRIQSRLESFGLESEDPNSWYPDYALSTDGKICKNITSYYKDGVDHCDY